MAIEVSGELAEGVSAKDLILAIIAKIGTGGGQGHIIEYRGEAIRMKAPRSCVPASMLLPNQATVSSIRSAP